MAKYVPEVKTCELDYTKGPGLIGRLAAAGKYVNSMDCPLPTEEGFPPHGGEGVIKVSYAVIPWNQIQLGPIANFFRGNYYHQYHGAVLRRHVEEVFRDLGLRCPYVEEALAILAKERADTFSPLSTTAFIKGQKISRTGWGRGIDKTDTFFFIVSPWVINGGIVLDGRHAFRFYMDSDHWWHRDELFIGVRK